MVFYLFVESILDWLFVFLDESEFCDGVLELRGTLFPGLDFAESGF